MKGVLIVDDKTLKAMFMKLSIDLTDAQSSSLTDETSDNVPDDRYFIFDRKSIYDIEYDDVNTACYKLNFTFKSGEDSHDVPISLSKYLFIRYQDINEMSIKEIKDIDVLNELLDIAKDEEDYDKCVIIRDYIKSLS